MIFLALVIEQFVYPSDHIFMSQQLQELERLEKQKNYSPAISTLQELEH